MIEGDCQKTAHHDSQAKEGEKRFQQSREGSNGKCPRRPSFGRRCDFRRLYDLRSQLRGGERSLRLDSNPDLRSAAMLAEGHSVFHGCTATMTGSIHYDSSYRRFRDARKCAG
jgi:hypothetical protein